MKKYIPSNGTERARRDALRHRQHVDAGRTEQRRAAMAMTGAEKQA